MKALFSKHRLFITALTVIAVLCVTNFWILSQDSQNFTSSFHVQGILTITVRDKNGTIVSQVKRDAITPLSYDYIACFVWSEGCNALSGSASNLIAPPTTYTTTATLSSYYCLCSALIGFAVSTSVQTSSSCNNVQTTNGLSPIASTVSHSQGVNTPIVTLVGSFTYTGGGVTLQSICLVPGVGPFAPSQFTSQYVFGISSTMTSFAYENYSGQTLSMGQSISFSWQFNM